MSRPGKTKTKKRSAPMGKASSSSSNDALKRHKIGARTAKALAAAKARSTLEISHLGESGVVTSERPNMRRLEIGAPAEAIACDNQNVTKKAGKGKVRHLFVLPGHLDLLKFADASRVGKKKAKSETEVSVTCPISGSPGGTATVAAVSTPKGLTDIEVGAVDSPGATSEPKDGALTSSLRDTHIPNYAFGAVAELGSGKPVLYIDVPAHGGRIKLCGTIVYPDAPLLTLQLPPASSKSSNIICDNIFNNMVVFDNLTWVPNKSGETEDEGASQRELEVVNLQKEREKFSDRSLTDKNAE